MAKNIFGETELDKEDLNLLSKARDADHNDAMAYNALSEARESTSPIALTSKEDIGLLNRIDPEQERLDKAANIFNQNLQSFMAKENSDRKNQPAYLQSLADSSKKASTSNAAEEDRSMIADLLVGGISGAATAVPEFLNTVDYLVESTTRMFGSDVDLMPIEEYTEASIRFLKDDNEFVKSTAGQIGAGIGQFFAGFAPIFRATKLIKPLNTTTKRVLAADFMTGATVFNEEDPNSFNMIQHVPFLKPLDDATGNVITEVLASDTDDPESWNRLRNGLSGVLEGKAIDGIVGALKYVSTQGKSFTQNQLGLFKPKSSTEIASESLEETQKQIAELKADYSKLKSSPERSSNLKARVRETLRANRLKQELEGKLVPDEQDYDFEAGRISREVQQEIEVIDPKIKNEIEGTLDSTLKARLGKDIGDIALEFEDDISKSIYIVSQSKSKKKSGIYRKFLEDEVGMSRDEISAIGEKIHRDLMESNPVAKLDVYRDEVHLDVLERNPDAANLEIQFKVKDPEGVKNHNVPVSETKRPLIKPANITDEQFEKLADSSIEAMTGSPVRNKVLFKGDKDVKVKKKTIIKDGVKVKIIQTEGTGGPKYIFKSKKTGLPFQINHGDVNTPKDLDNLYTWLRREFSDDGFGDRVKLREEEIKAHALLPQALDSDDPLAFMLENKISAETAILSRLVHGTALHNLRDLALKRATGDTSAETKNQYLKTLAYWANAHSWQGLIARKSAQATRAFGHNIRGAANDKLLEKILQEATSGKGVSKMDLDKLSKMIQKTESMEGANAAVDAVMNKAGVVDMMIEHYMGVGLLSAISTNIANITAGMTLATVMQPAEKAFAKAFAGNAPEAVQELVDGYLGLFSVKPLKVFAKTAWEGKPTGYAASKMEIREQTITGSSVIDAGENRVSAYRYLGNLNRGGTRFLIAGDDLVRTTIHEMQVTVAARKQARAEGLTGEAFAKRNAYLQKYPEALKNYDSVKLEATRLGDEATFTQELNGMVGQLGEAAYKYPIIRLFTPFVKVMYNIPKYYIERDPLIQTARIAKGKVFGGEFAEKMKDPKFRANQHSKMLSGTLLLGTGVMLAANGIITGSSRRDYGQEKNKMMVNHFPTSIRFEDDKGGIISKDFSRLEPYASFLQTAADLVEIIPQIHDEEKRAELIVQAVWAMADNLVSDTWVPGLADLMLLAQGRNSEQALEKSLKRIVTGFTPALARELSRKNDSVIAESRGGALNLMGDRMSHYGSTAYQQSFQQLMMRMKGTIPGYNKYPKYDSWGDMLMRGGNDPTDSSIWDVLAPMAVKRQKYDEVDEYIEEIKLVMSDLAPSITIAGMQGGAVPLNPAQLEQYHLLSKKDLSYLPDKDVLTPKDILKLRNAPSGLKNEIRELINDKEFRELQVSGFGKFDNQKAYIKNIFLRRREIARNMIPYIKGNENLITESEKRNRIARQNPDIIFN